MSKNNNAYKRASLLIQQAKGPKWKQELVSDHKFDFIDVEEFRDYTCLLTIRYFILLCSVFISFAAYGADIWSAGILLIYDHWSLSTQPKIPFYISKWIYVGCIVLSFMLVAWEIRKTRSIMETRDISLAVTNPLSYRTYSVRSYSHFCLLQKIKNSTKWSDVIIFYVFYTLKGWKKVIIAQGPRQIIAGITVYALLKSAWTDANGYFKFSNNWDTYGQDWPQRVALLLMSFTCILWIFTAIQIVLAVLLYFPILCHVQGNLKEYCCHKIDKRIDELLEKQRKKRLRETEKKYANSVSSKKSKKSTKKGNGKDGNDLEPIPALPTLPVISDVDLYAGEKKTNPWLYQQPQHQNTFNNNYHDSQPMTPLESNYSLQRNPTNKYTPYNEALINQPSGAYMQQDNTSNYYYPGATANAKPLQQNNQYSSNATAAAMGSNKPHAYDDSPKITNGSTGNINTYNNSSNSNINTYSNNSNSNINAYNNTSNNSFSNNAYNNTNNTSNYYKANPATAINISATGTYSSQPAYSYNNNSSQQQQQVPMTKRMNTTVANNSTGNSSTTYSATTAVNSSYSSSPVMSNNNAPAVITSPKKKDAVIALNSSSNGTNNYYNSSSSNMHEENAFSGYYKSSSSSSSSNNKNNAGDHYALQDQQQQHYYNDEIAAEAEAEAEDYYYSQQPAKAAKTTTPTYNNKQTPTNQHAYNDYI